MFNGKTVLVRIKKNIVLLRTLLTSTVLLCTLLICTVTMITSCATHVDNVHRIQLDENIVYVLQPIPDSLLNTSILASFTVKQQGKENQFLMQVEMTASRLLISGMTVEGLSLFSLDWHTELGTLDYDKKIAIEPQRVLAELQLALWPVTNIYQGLENGKLAVDKHNMREISAQGEVIYQIKIHGKNSQLVNLKHNYSIVVEELERWTLPEQQVKTEK